MTERPSSEIATDRGDSEGPLTDVERPKVIVAGIDLSREAWDELAAVLGPGHVVRSIRDPGDVVDIVLVPPVSRQLTGALRGMFRAQPRAALGSAGQRPTELGWSGATTTRIVHVISGDLDLQTEAARLSAVSFR